MNLKILILEKSLSIYNLVKESSLVQEGRIYFSDTKEDIYNFIRNNDITVIITDMEEKPKNGDSFVQDIKAFDSLVDVILVGKQLTSEKVLNLINQGATDYLIKPVKEKDLNKTLKNIEKKRVLRKNTHQLEMELEKKYFFQGIVGKSPYMLETFSLIEKISPYFSCVLITGETGTGKKLVAHAIHNLSPVNNKRFLEFDCVSVPGSFYEPMLLGFKKGSFAGANRDKMGFFEKADKGIVFLDEIAEIPLSSQAKIMQVLEQQQVTPLGGAKAKEVNVKVLASTNRNLKECVKKEEFREDLFKKLTKVKIYLLPLRKRAEDIPLLVRYFLKRFNKKHNKTIKGISQRVQKFFHSYEWPGNVSELEDVLEKSVISTDKEFIDVGELPEYFQEGLAHPKKIPFIKREDLSSLNTLEKEYIIYLLKRTHNNMSKTARILGVTRTTLYNKLKKYQISH